jgi:hypothetical protein
MAAALRHSGAFLTLSNPVTDRPRVRAGGA